MIKFSNKIIPGLKYKYDFYKGKIIEPSNKTIKAFMNDEINPLKFKSEFNNLHLPDDIEDIDLLNDILNDYNIISQSKIIKPVNKLLNNITIDNNITIENNTTINNLLDNEIINNNNDNNNSNLLDNEIIINNNNSSFNININDKLFNNNNNNDNNNNKLFNNNDLLNNDKLFDNDKNDNNELKDFKEYHFMNPQPNNKNLLFHNNINNMFNTLNIPIKQKNNNSCNNSCNNSSNKLCNNLCNKLCNIQYKTYNVKIIKSLTEINLNNIDKIEIYVDNQMIELNKHISIVQLTELICDLNVNKIVFIEYANNKNINTLNNYYEYYFN